MKPDSLHWAVLMRIAAREGLDPESICIGQKGAVFYCHGEQLLCWCQVGSTYWNALEAEVVAVQAIERAARK